MQLSRSIYVTEISKDEKYTVGSWRLICFYKVLRFFKLDAHKAYSKVGKENKQFKKLKF
jgi:hypothetical protein